MKKILYILMVAVMMVAIGGCRRASDNGAIDGYWRVVGIEDLSTGEELNVGTSRFFAIQLELMQLSSTSGECSTLTGVMAYDKDNELLSVDFKGANKNALALFGIYEDPITFTVVRASSKTLMLRTSRTLITCR
jgi:hypothetical protein